MSGLGKLILIYAGDYNEQYPIADKWCDLLVENEDAYEKQFICPAAAQGRGSYAMNPNCGPNSPNDTVLLFETKAGWNQTGGPELLTFENHEGQGCNVLFNDGHAKFIKPEDANKLNWGQEVRPGKTYMRQTSSIEMDSKQKAERILTSGRLANLPESATDLKVEGWSGIFTGEDYMKFRATSEDIDEFLRQSSSINSVAIEVFNSEHNYLPRPETTDFTSKAEREKYVKHKYYYRHNEMPAWYEPMIKIRGRMYEIPGDPNMRGHNWGSVIVNDETNTVYINVIWS